MRTYEQMNPAAPPALKKRALETLGLAIAFGLVPQLLGARAGAVLAPHPGWIAVLVLAARHGTPGFYSGLFTTGATVVLGSSLAGAGFASPWVYRDAGQDLIAFGACLAVSWIASWQLRMRARLSARLRALSHRAAQA